MRILTRCIHRYILSILFLTFFLASVPAQAVPSFARQTGMPCESCHTIFPELTSTGRSFKMGGYTLTNMKQIEAALGKKLRRYRVNKITVSSFRRC